MTTLFSRIIDGEIPGRFVWTDTECVAFGTIEPLQPGHVLVVPRAEIDHWVDLPDLVCTHLLSVARTIGRAQREAFSPARIGLMAQGYEVPHAHVHVWPSLSPADFDLSSAAADVPGAELDSAMLRLREALVTAGHQERVPRG